MFDAKIFAQDMLASLTNQICNPYIQENASTPCLKTLKNQHPLSKDFVFNILPFEGYSVNIISIKSTNDDFTWTIGTKYWNGNLIGYFNIDICGNKSLIINAWNEHHHNLLNQLSI